LSILDLGWTEKNLAGAKVREETQPPPEGCREGEPENPAQKSENIYRFFLR
tara:strand:- start:324 stop:476 length:153 start_codon:yes stop_codon:yes gene_type:complete